MATLSNFTMNIKISVIIPTYNRSDILLKTLDALNRQKFLTDNFEIIIINDGSSDDTENKVTKYLKINKDLNAKYLKQKNSGQGIARNNGIAHCKGDIIVFIGDDIIVSENFLTEHLKFHQKYKSGNDAVLGFIDWHPEIQITNFMKWLTNGSSIFGKFGGHQFAYEKLNGKDIADFNFFYTSNISIKREIIEKKEDQFDCDFGTYGWEDIELGYRLQKKYGLKLHYNPNAIAFHYHYLDEKSLKQRMQSIGQSAHIIHNKHPELKKIPSKLKQLIFLILGSLPSLALIWLMKNISKKYTTLWFYALSKRYFMQGLRKF